MNDCDAAHVAATEFVNAETTPAMRLIVHGKGTWRHPSRLDSLGYGPLTLLMPMLGLDCSNMSPQPRLMLSSVRRPNGSRVTRLLRQKPRSVTSDGGARSTRVTADPTGARRLARLYGVRSHIGLDHADGTAHKDIHPRVQLHKVGAVCNGGVHIGTVYLHDRLGPTHPSNIDVLDVAARRLSLLSGPWVLWVTSTATPPS